MTQNNNNFAIHRAEEETTVKVSLWANPPKHGQATGRFFRVQVNHGRHGAYNDVDASLPKVRLLVALAAGRLGEHLISLQEASKGGLVIKTKIDPNVCAQLAGEAFDELTAANPVAHVNPYKIN